MAHFALLWKARTIEKYRLKYEKEKINSIIMSNAEIPDKTLFQRWRHYRHDMSRHISRTFSKWYPEGTTVSNLLLHFRADMKFPQILLRSLFGFIGGLILTYLCFIFFVFQLSLSLGNAIVLSSIIGVLLTLGLTLSNRMRCLMFLLIPQLFSRVGRYTLTCYALVLILTGPATNTLKNLEVLSESMACSQEQLKTNYRNLNDFIKKPFNSIKNSIDLMVQNIKQITFKLKMALIYINRLLMSTSSIIQASYSWLDSVTKVCYKYFAAPYKKCRVSLIKNAKMLCPQCKKNSSWFSIVLNLADKSCSYLKPYKSFCIMANYADETFLATIKGKLKHFTQRIGKIISMHVQVHHSYTFIGNSRSDSQVTAGIVTEIRNRADPILTWLSWSSCVTSLFLLLIIFRAKYYQRMYESRSRFDNRFITNEFRELDLKRLREGRETVLPLNRRERAKYVTTTSFRLVASEKLYINRSVIFMIITTFKLMIHIVADYSLYWVLMMIRHHGSKETPLKPGVSDVGVHVTGKGFVARFIRSMLNTLNIPLRFSCYSNKECLPDPHPPDYKRYTQIGILIFLLWFFALFEPYGLRLRHLIVGHYRPERAKARAVWLYNHILRTRGSFMKLARRKLHREHKYSSEKKLTFRCWLKSLVPFAWLRNWLGISDEEGKCLLCNTTEEPSNSNTKIVRCKVPNCPGTYCIKCFSDIGQMCTICLPPLDYVDLSDVSMEKGSSDDDSNDEGGPSLNMNNNMDTNANNDDNTQNKDNISEHSDDSDSKYSSEIYPLLNNRFNATDKLSVNTMNNDNLSNLNGPINFDSRSSKRFSYTGRKCKMKTRFNNSRYLINNILNVFVIQYELHSILKQNRLYKALKIFDIVGVTQITNTIIIPILLINSNKHFANILQNAITESKNKKETEPDEKINKNKKKEKKKDKPEKERKKSAPQSNKKDIKKSNKKKNKLPKDNPDGDKPDKPKTKKKKKAKTSLEDVRFKIDKKGSKYWKNILFCIIPCRKQKKTSLPSSQINCKKKKKKKCKENETKDEKTSTKFHDKSVRVFAYLTELDWIMNKKCDRSTDINEREILREVQSESMIRINDILIPKLNLNFSTESVCVEVNKMNNDSHRSQKKINGTKKRKEYSKKAIERYFKKSYKDPWEAHSKAEDVESLSTDDNDLKDSGTQYDIQRPLKYFSSLGHNDFIDNVEDLVALDMDEFDFLLASSQSTHQRHVNTEEHDTAGDQKETENKETEISVNLQEKENNNKETICQTNDDNDVGNKSDVKGNTKPKKFSKIMKLCSSTNDLIGIEGDSKTSPSRKNSSTNSSCKWLKLRQVLSDKIPCVKCPMSMVKGLYNAFLPSEVRLFQGRRYMYNADKAVNVSPKMCSCACQRSVPTTIKDRFSLSRLRKPKSSPRVYDAQVEVHHSTCTCATQYYVTNRDVGTFRNSSPQSQRSNYTTDDSNGTLTDSLISGSHTSESAHSKGSEDEKTDTTVYSLATVDYCDPAKRAKRMKIKVITKTNQSTYTNTNQHVDVSTITDDWWSPLIEKKDIKQVENKGDTSTSDEVYRKRRVSRNRRVVTFESFDKIVPYAGTARRCDILTAKRFLYESQNSRHEIFSPKEHGYGTQSCKNAERVCSSISSRRRNRKTKRLEDRYSPRKLQSTRQKRTELLKAIRISSQIQ